jgi:hypothetical protein
MRIPLAAVAAAALLVAAAPAAAHDPTTRSGGGPTATAAQFQAPPATPRADCGPGSDPEPGLQGRVAADAPGRADGFRCNTELAGEEGVSGGFKVLRYVDAAGHECAFYDTTLMFPTNVLSLSGQPTGVAVLDMSDPAKPVRTDTLVTPAMQTPHESLELNERRGLLAAVTGNAIAYPGAVDVYDVSKDCRRPELQSVTATGGFGHESGFAPDGNTFYVTSISTGEVTAIDLADPKAPKVVWSGSYKSHGLMVSDDGNRLYLAMGAGSFAGDGLLILDSSEVQARRPNPQVREVGRLKWPEVTIPQVAIPVTIGGRPFAVEVDEFSAGEDGEATQHGIRVGAARIIDLADEANPKVVSNLRLDVHQPEHREAIRDDPGTFSPVQGYAAHYCNVPRRDDPGIVACSFILSGLRVFDIRDPYHPKELAYFVAPPAPSSRSGGEATNYAMSRPAFNPERSEIWYSDGNAGFYNVRLTNGVWPFSGDGAGSGGAGGGSGDGSCTSTAGLRSVSAAPRGRGLRIAFGRRGDLPVDVEVFQVAKGRRVVRENRVARFAGATSPLAWRARGVPDGTYFVRFSMIRDGRRVDVRRVVLARRGGRFVRRPGHHRRAACGVLRQFKLERPVFGGRRGVPLRIAYRLRSAARVSVVVTRGGRVVKRFRAGRRRAGVTVRLAVPARGLPRGAYRVRLEATGAGDRVVATLRARRI